MSIATASDFEIAPARPLATPMLLALACVALAVAAFSLTYLRLAAFIWMVLVAVAANAITLAVVLYGCCFINAPWLVESYNVEHCREVGGAGPNLDMKYLESLGSAQTLPPLEAHLAQFPDILPLSLAHRISTDREYLALPGHWRAWGFRTWRLERYFAKTPPERLNPPESGKG